MRSSSNCWLTASYLTTATFKQPSPWLQRHLPIKILDHNDIWSIVDLEISNLSHCNLWEWDGSLTCVWPFLRELDSLQGKILWTVRTNDEWSSTRWAGSLAVRRLVICTKMNKMETIPAENKTPPFPLSQRKLSQILRNFRSEKCKILVKFK